MNNLKLNLKNNKNDDEMLDENAEIRPAQFVRYSNEQNLAENNSESKANQSNIMHNSNEQKT